MVKLLNTRENMDFVDTDNGHEVNQKFNYLISNIKI